MSIHSKIKRGYQVAAIHLEQKYEDIVGPSRKREFVWARHLAQTAIYQALVDDPERSLALVGWHCGGRDHTTVINALNSVQDDIDTDVLIKKRKNTAGILARLTKVIKDEWISMGMEADPDSPEDEVTLKLQPAAFVLEMPDVATMRNKEFSYAEI